MNISRFVVMAALCAVGASPLAAARAPAAAPAAVTERSVAAHLSFLASDALQGRGSATRDEAIAAAYVAAQFEGDGLERAPGMDGFIQTATILRPRASGPASLTVDGAAVSGVSVLVSNGDPVGGALTVAAGADPATLPQAPVVLASARGGDPLALFRAAGAKHIDLLIVRESERTRALLAGLGGSPRLPVTLEGSAKRDGGPTIATLPDAAVDALVAKGSGAVRLTLPVTVEKVTTSNAVGYLKGTDPKAGTLLFTAHLDHLGRAGDGAIMHGANDDASGTTAVLELAKLLAARRAPRRSILFVAYGSEEIGGLGSTYFAQHPPVPLTDIVANLEFEMIGAQDPKLPANTLMMTGFERSNLGPALKEHGGLVAADPYPDQHFFQRSDNYSLALQGVVAHTISGWAVTPTYHTANDTIANINVPFMARAIRSLVAPVEWLADGRFVPAWRAGGKPSRGE